MAPRRHVSSLVVAFLVSFARGSPSLTPSLTPRAPCAGAINAYRSSFSAGAFDTCVITPSGALTCWGDDYYGELSISISLPSQVVSNGRYGACAISAATSSLACWGRNDYGQGSVPSIVIGPTLAVSSGVTHVCAVDIAVGAVTCWGSTDYGKSSPPPLTGQIAVQCGLSHSCSLGSNGAITCWGDNSVGQLQISASALAGGQVYITAGYSHTCALSANGTISCWGESH